jgi:hypothetical protein
MNCSALPMGGCGDFPSAALFCERTFNHAGRYFNMKLSKKTKPIVALVAFCLVLSFPMVASAREVDSAIAACLKAWGDHPFGKTPQFKTLGTSIKVFGIGSEASDTEPTSSPSLVLINPSVNVLGGSTIELLNPNGWYCMRTTVSVMGRFSIRANCKAHLASTSAGVTVVANNGENRSFKDIAVTSISSIAVERPCN